MGLDTSHGCWHGAYSAFARWRNKLAEVAGYEIAEVKFRDSMFTHECALVDYGHISSDETMGDWAQTPADPLLVLIAHSDCDGWIRARDAGPLADRIAELLPLLPDEAGVGHIRHWRDTTQRFIDGLRAAAEAGEDVVFS